MKLYYALLALSVAMQVHAGPLETLSVGAHWLWTLGGTCPKYDAGQVHKDFEHLQSLSTSSFHREPLSPAELKEALSDRLENHFFGELAHRHARELRCGEDFSRNVSAGDSSDEFTNRLRLLRAVRLHVSDVLQKMTDSGIDLTACPTPGTPPSNSVFKQCDAYFAGIASYNAIRQSIPLNNFSAVKILVNTYVDASKDAVVPLEADLKTRVERAYGESSKDLEKHAIRLESRVMQNGGAAFNRSEKHDLLIDPALTLQMLKDMGDSRDDHALACRADAEYGSGATQLEAVSFLGGTVFAAGGSLMLGGLKASEGLIAAVSSARAAGNMSMLALNVLLQGGNLAFNAVGTLSLASCSEYRPEITDVTSATGECISAPKLSDLGHDHCVLFYSLMALRFAWDEGTDILAMTGFQSPSLPQRVPNALKATKGKVTAPAAAQKASKKTN